MKSTILIFALLLHTLNSEGCKRLLMRSYMLQGLKEPNNSVNPLCHTITKNCCTPQDLLKIFDEASNTMQPALIASKGLFIVVDSK